MAIYEMTAVSRTKTRGLQVLGTLRVDQLLYYIAFGLYVLDIFLDRTTFEYVLLVSVTDFQQVLQFCALVLLLIKTVLYQRASVMQWLIAVLLVILGFITWRVSANGWLFWTVLFVVSGQGVEVRQLACVSLIVLLPTLALTVTCALFGIIENRVGVHSSTGAVRTAMGFTNPNYLGFYSLEICMAISTLRFGRTPFIDMLPIGIAFFVSLIVANSRTSMLCLALLVVLLWFFYLTKTELGRSKSIVCITCLIGFIVVISIYTMVAYTSSDTLMAQINSLLSNRLLYANKYYSYYGVSLLGRDYTNSAVLVYSFSGYYTFVVDNAYCQILLRFGAVAFAVFLLGIGAFYLDAFKTHRWDIILLGITLFLIFGFSEYKGIVFADNYFLIGLSEVLYRKACTPLAARARSRKVGAIAVAKNAQ